MNFYELIDLIKQLIGDNDFTNKITFGELADVDLNKDTTFPLLHIMLEQVTIQASTMEYRLNIIAADIVDRGIMLAGGGALVRGINDLLSDETGIFTHIAENPLLCVVNGCGEVLDDFKKLKRVVDTPDFIRNAIRD